MKTRMVFICGLFALVSTGPVEKGSFTENSSNSTNSLGTTGENNSIVEAEVANSNSAVSVEAKIENSTLSPEANNSHVCVSQDCIQTAHNLLNSMSLGADPCEDFYEFACGRFVSESRIPDEKGRWSNFDVVGEQIYHQGRILLESEPAPDDFDSYKLARDYYASCIDEDQREVLGVQPILKKLREFGGWPVLDGESWSGESNFTWWEWTYKLNRAGFGISAMVTFSMSADDKNASYKTIGFDQAVLGMSREYLIKGFDDPDVQHYYTFMVETATLLGAPEEYAREQLKESLLFEIQLAHVTAPKEERRNATQLYNPTTLGAMPKLEGMPPSWTEFVQTILEEADKANVNDDEKVILTNTEYLGRLSELVKATKPRVLANYMGWQMTKTVVSYLNQAGQKIKQNYDKAISGVQESPPVWKRCVAVIGFNSVAGSFSLGLVAGSMYVRKYFNQDAKQSMLEMTSYIKKSFNEDILNNLDWMDEATKARARQKLDAMDQYIAYQDEFIDRDKVDGLHKNITVSRTDYLENALNIIKFWRVFYYNKLREKIDSSSWLEHSDVSVVNAFYSGDANNIEFPAGILQGVFFNAQIPKYMNFGSIGSVIGHEITHGFDDKGKQRNGDGEIENWWDPVTEASFHQKAQCIIDQYTNFTDPQVGLSLNGFNNQGENIADNGGLKQAYKGYLRWIADNHEEPKIVGLDYTPKQMFWVSFSQVWCTKYRDGSLKQQILTGAHSPGNFRVQGSLMNNEDFARDFNCPLGSKMNPVNKCSVW